MPSSGQKVTRLRILAISWLGVGTIQVFITVCHLKRFVITSSSSCTDSLSSLEALQGYLVDWDAQKAIWDGVLSPEVLNVRPSWFRLDQTLNWHLG